MIKSMVCGGGVEVQTYSGSFTTTTSGVGTISCGFKPDLIILYMANDSDYEFVAALPVAERKTSRTLDTVSWGNGDWDFVDVELASVTSTGATVRMHLYNETSTGDYYARKTISYRAIKYTE